MPFVTSQSVVNRLEGQRQKTSASVNSACCGTSEYLTELLELASMWTPALFLGRGGKKEDAWTEQCSTQYNLYNTFQQLMSNLALRQSFVVRGDCVQWYESGQTKSGAEKGWVLMKAPSFCLGWVLFNDVTKKQVVNEALCKNNTSQWCCWWFCPRVFFSFSQSMQMV